MSSVARLLGVSRSTIYKYVPELTETRTVTAEAADRTTEMRSWPRPFSDLAVTGPWSLWWVLVCGADMKQNASPCGYDPQGLAF